MSYENSCCLTVLFNVKIWLAGNVFRVYRHYADEAENIITAITIVYRVICHKIVFR